VKHPHIQYHTVPRETFSTVDEIIEEYYSPLYKYLELLLWWNSRVNLVSRDVPRETVWEHIRHSLILSQFSELRTSGTIVDAGTGGGLPGLPLAVTHPRKSFVLNDIVSKKCLAVKQIVKKLNLQNVTVFDGSIEDIPQDTPFLLVTKHAFKIDELYKCVSHHPWQKLVFYKGLDFEDELKTIGDKITVSVYDLYNENRDSFYKDKALITVAR